MKHGHQPTVRNHERPDPPTTGSAVVPPKTSWNCAARKQGTAGGNDPADCDWPVCGCDPYADKVIAALQDTGVIVAAPGWKLVPARPTEAMIKAAGSEWVPERLWRAMLAAAPSPDGCGAE